MNELIELGLNEQDRPSVPELEPSPTVELASFSARLLALVGDTAVESDTLNTYEFRAKLEKYRHRLANSVHRDPKTAGTASDCLQLCQDYLTRAHKYLLERENEFAEVIDVMRVALSKLAGDAKS